MVSVTSKAAHLPASTEAVLPEEVALRHFSALAFPPEALPMVRAACSHDFTGAVLPEEEAFRHSSALASCSLFSAKAAISKKVVLGTLH